MQGQTKTQLHQHQDQWTKTTGQENHSQRSQILNKPGNQVLVQKKQNLNQRLYHAHLKCAHQYNGMWRHIQGYMDQQIHETMEGLQIHVVRFSYRYVATPL
jgi:hypothetical protein